MSDIHITKITTGFDANDVVVLSPPCESVSFTSDADCKICFEMPETFGITSFDMVANVVVRIKVLFCMTTDYWVVPAGSGCPNKKIDSSPGSHTITMGSGG